MRRSILRRCAHILTRLDAFHNLSRIEFNVALPGSDRSARVADQVTKKVDFGKLAGVSANAGLATTMARHCAREIATFRRLGSNRKSIPRGHSLASEAHRMTPSCVPASPRKPLLLQLPHRQTIHEDDRPQHAQERAAYLYVCISRFLREKMDYDEIKRKAVRQADRIDEESQYIGRQSKNPVHPQLLQLGFTDYVDSLQRLSKNHHDRRLLPGIRKSIRKQGVRLRNGSIRNTAEKATFPKVSLLTESYFTPFVTLLSKRQCGTIWTYRNSRK